MSSLQKSTKPLAAAAGARDFASILREPTNILILALVALTFSWYFHFWLFQQHRIALSNTADWGHTYFVPVVSVYLLWQSRRELSRTSFVTFWPGILAVVLGVVSYVFFVVGVPNHMGQGLSLVLSLFGVVLTLLGPRAMRYCFFPIAYMLFAITLPEKWMIEMTFPLQLIASEGSYVLLEILGVNLTLKGNVLNVIDVHGELIPLNVAEQCSGMRTLVSFVALGAAVCLVATRAWWKRIVLMALTLPVAVALNILRVAVLAYLAQYNPGLSAGEAHTLIGTLLLIPGLFAYLGIVWALNKAVQDAPEEDPWVVEERMYAPVVYDAVDASPAQHESGAASAPASPGLGGGA